MRIKSVLILIALALIPVRGLAAQTEAPGKILLDAGASGFVISLKNGSTIRGRTLSRDDQTGKLRLAMTESGGEANSYAIIAPEDAAEIRSSASESDSIRIKLKGGSDLRCKEFSLEGDSVAVKLGSATKIEVKWADIESISFAQ